MKSKKKNKQIRDKVKELIDVLIQLSIEKFWIHFKEKLKTGFYATNTVKEMFDKLLDYIIVSVKSVNGLKLDEREVDRRIRSEITQKFRENNANYLQKCSEVKSVIERAQNESIGLYSDKMNEFMSKNPSRGRALVQSKSTTFRSDAIKNYGIIITIQ